MSGFYVISVEISFLYRLIHKMSKKSKNIGNLVEIQYF
jgi:hypothetical protein